MLREKLIFFALLASLCAGHAIPYLANSTLEDGGSFRADTADFGGDDDNADVANIPEKALGALKSTFTGGQENPMTNMLPTQQDNDSDSKDKMFALAGKINDVSSNDQSSPDLSDAFKQASEAMPDGLVPAAGERRAPFVPSEMMGEKNNLGDGDLSNPDAVATAAGGAVQNPFGEAAFRKPAEGQRPFATTELKPQTKKSLEENLGFPSLDHLYSNIDDKFTAAKNLWDHLIGQENIQEDVKVGLVKADETLVDTELTKKAVLEAGMKADSSIRYDRQSEDNAKSAVQLASKAEQDDDSIKQAAAEAKRWMDKILERTAAASVDSKAATDQVQKAEKLAEETLQRDTEVREEMKAVYVQSHQATKEAAEAKALLHDLQTRETQAQDDAKKAKMNLDDVKAEEQRLREEEDRLKRELIKAQASQTHTADELKETKNLLEKQLKDVSEQSKQNGEAKATLEQRLASADAELAKAKGALEAQANATKLEQEALEKQQEEQSKMVEQAMEEVKQAKQVADDAVKGQKAAEDKADRLEKELQMVEAKMKEKLELAHSRTKEWLHSQTTELVQETSLKDQEISRLKLEIINLEKEERAEREQRDATQQRLSQEDSLFQQQQGYVKQLQTQELKQQELLIQRDHYSNKHRVSNDLPMIEALQLEEGQQQQEQAVVEQAKPTAEKKLDKAEVFQKMEAARKKVERLMGTSLTPGLDLERNDATLTRRGNKMSSSAEGALPSGYPPPMGTTKLQLEDQTNLELGEGRDEGYGDPIIAQGVHDPNTPPPTAHRDNCIRICSGGDATSYRDGVVDTNTTKTHPHETGACMKMCAMFTIEAQNSADPETVTNELVQKNTALLPSRVD